MGQPVDFLASQEPDREDGLRGSRRAPRRLHGLCRLPEREAGMIEKGAAGKGQLDAARAAHEELGADFQLEVTQLPAQGGLRGVQPLLGGDREAALFGDGDKIAKMTQLHVQAMPVRYGSWTYKVFFRGASNA